MMLPPSSMDGRMRLTVEEIPPGPLPRWVMDHAIHQAKHSITGKEKSKILFIYPNQNSRSETLDRISELIPVFDRSFHHTITTLTRVIGADLQIKRPMKDTPGLDECIHILATRAAEKLRFPILHPFQDRPWHRGKTESLRGLHQALLSEDSLHGWEGASEAIEFGKILHEISESVGQIHPELLLYEVIRHLETPNSPPPFTLEGIDGILVLNHDPCISKLQRRFLLSLLLHVPIHQLSYTGNYRRGEHGFQIADVYPVTTKHQLPIWIPQHEPTRSHQHSETRVMEAQVEVSSETFASASHFIKRKRLDDPSAKIMIIDPMWSDRESEWNRSICSIPSMINPSLDSETTNPFLSSLIADMTVGIGNRAFSMESLRGVNDRGILGELRDIPKHPLCSDIKPEFHDKIIETCARNHHITGGQGSLSDWLHAMSKINNDGEHLEKLEEVQWWLLIIASNISPLLEDYEREALRNPTYRRGCKTGAELPIPVSFPNADDWISGYLESLADQKSDLSNKEQLSQVTQAIDHIHQSLDNFSSICRALSLNVVQHGHEWVDRTHRLIMNPIGSEEQVRDPNLRILRPEDALGCTADLVLITHLSSEWSMKPPKIPLLTDQDRYELDIAGPDLRIKSARHSFRHLLNSAPDVIVIHATNDESSLPSLILDEWLGKQEKDEPDNTHVPYLKTSPRDLLSQNGLMIGKGIPGSRKPLGEFTPLIELSRSLVDDMIQRTPTKADDDGFLSETSTNRVMLPPVKEIANPSSKAKSNPPRLNHRWPVIGAGKHHSDTATVDPRPLDLAITGISQHDARHGQTNISMSRRKWSPSRLKRWLDCPRKGWLTDKLSLSEDERSVQDLDSRVYGSLLHGIHHDLQLGVLGLRQGEEANSQDFHSGPFSISTSEIQDDELMMIGLNSLSSRAPWLLRSDAVSTQRLWMLTGLSPESWSSWLADPKPIPSAGRIGSLIAAEKKLQRSGPLALEWQLNKLDRIIEVEIGQPFAEEGKKSSPFISTGFVDRIDLVPFDENCQRWVDENGCSNIAPLRITGTGWKPRRLILIRDLKTSETSIKPIKRHERAIFDELQLAIYSRAWEIAHPGDLVIGAGVSMLGFDSEHMIEISDWAPEWIKDASCGSVTKMTSNMFRFYDEGPDTDSDPFRAWMTHRLTVAGRIVHNANSGVINPTPSSNTCDFCEGKNLCNQRMAGGRLS